MLYLVVFGVGLGLGGWGWGKWGFGRVVWVSLALRAGVMGWVGLLVEEEEDK